MRSIRGGCLVLALTMLAAFAAKPALADEAASLYDPGKVVFIELTLSPEEEAKLEKEPGEYVKGTFSLTESSDGTPAGKEMTPLIPTRPVEVRLKGNVGGSFRPLSKKPGLKLKFKKTETLLGLRKMTLNNMVQDPSMVHETLAYAAFRAVGVPASRTGFAYVLLNGEEIGVYLDLETLDETALSRIFGSFDSTTQHLYEGEDGHDVTPGEATKFEVDEGPKSIADLEELIEVVNSEPAEGESWSEHVAAKLDLAEMVKMWAVEKYIDHWDGYSGHAEAGLRPNNYYLFSEPSGRFQILPWGADQTWIPTINVGTPDREVTFDGKGGVLFNKCLEDDQCFRAYWRAVRDVRVAIANLDPAALAESSAALLGPWQADEFEHGRPEYQHLEEIKEGKNGLEETLEFINDRSAEAYSWLAANTPPGEVIEPEKPEEKSGDNPPPQSPPPAEAPAPGSLAVNGFIVNHTTLRTRLGLSAPGTVSEDVSMGTRSGRRRVCSIQNQAVSLAATLRCRLSKAARQRLGEGPLRLRVTLSFVPGDGGAVAVASRTITAPRWRPSAALDARPDIESWRPFGGVGDRFPRRFRAPLG